MMLFQCQTDKTEATLRYTSSEQSILHQSLSADTSLSVSLSVCLSVCLRVQCLLTDCDSVAVVQSVDDE